MVKVLIDEEIMVAVIGKDENVHCTICKKPIKDKDSVYVCEVCHKMYHKPCYLKKLQPVMRRSNKICFHRDDEHALLYCLVNIR